MAQPKCEVVSVTPVLLAVAQEELPREQVSKRILGLFDVVYRWNKDAGIARTGNNHALYDCCTPTSLRLQVGFPVSERFADTELITCVQLAPGRAAHAVHVGPYAELHQTYAALHRWCADQGLALTGESWEVYGDWSDDPSKLETGLFLRIAEA